MIVVTANELAAKLEVDYPTASAIAKLMVKKGKGRMGPPRPNPGGRGKPSLVYELDNEFTISLG